MNKALLDELMLLSPAERLKIADKLWDSVDPNDPSVADELAPLTDEQKAEIDRRLAEHERDPSRALPWEEVRARLWARLDKLFGRSLLSQRPRLRSQKPLIGIMDEVHRRGLGF